MMNLKKYTSIILILSFSLVFSGCRSKIGPDTGTGGAATEILKELVVWNLYDNSDSLQGQIQAFQSSHPGVRISYKKFVNIDISLIAIV